MKNYGWRGIKILNKNYFQTKTAKTEVMGYICKDTFGIRLSQMRNIFKNYRSTVMGVGYMRNYGWSGKEI